MSDKVMRQPVAIGDTPPSQIIASYMTVPPSGFATSTGFSDPDGNIDLPFLFLGVAETELVFGDLDGDKINDSGVIADEGNAAFGDIGLGDIGYLGDFNGDGIADRLINRVSTNQAFIDLSVLGAFGDGIPHYGPIALGISDAQLDSTFGPSIQPKVFIRVVKQPQTTERIT